MLQRKAVEIKELGFVDAQHSSIPQSSYPVARQTDPGMRALVGVHHAGIALAREATAHHSSWSRLLKSGRIGAALQVLHSNPATAPELAESNGP